MIRVMACSQTIVESADMLNACVTGIYFNSSTALATKEAKLVISLCLLIPMLHFIDPGS